jgi:periplasmic divalent cation tolerance protein
MSRADAGVHVVLITAPDAEVGARIARSLVEERLVACVNIVPGVRSIYRYEGRVHDDPEVLLVAKTRSERIEMLTERVNALHPYDLPEVLALPGIGGSAPYLDWVRTESGDEPA